MGNHAFVAECTGPLYTNDIKIRGHVFVPAKPNRKH